MNPGPRGPYSVQIAEARLASEHLAMAAKWAEGVEPQLVGEIGRLRARLDATIEELCGSLPHQVSFASRRNRGAF